MHQCSKKENKLKANIVEGQEEEITLTINRTITLRPRVDILPKVFTPDECDALIDFGRANLQTATFGGHDKKWIKSLTRRSQVSWFQPKQNELVDKLLARAKHQIIEIARKQHRVAINWFESVQFTEYPILGHYKNHMDVGLGRHHRVISATIELSPKGSYIGGGLWLDASNVKNVKTERGTAVVFPSIMRHKAKTVWWGKRNSLVFWGQFRDDIAKKQMDNAKRKTTDQNPNPTV